MRVRCCLLLFACPMAMAATYEAGPGRAIESIEGVPWARLTAGDTVLIHWRPEPYRVKWAIGARGTAEAPVIIRGIPGPQGQLPVISGENATVLRRPFFRGPLRTVIKVTMTSRAGAASHVIIENLEVMSARRPLTWKLPTKAGENVLPYSKNATTIWVEKGRNITIRNCVLHDAGNGLFVSKASKDILIEGCHIYDNGVERSGQEHNIYSEANGITFRNNRLGPLKAGAGGNNLKDRSAGLVVEGNWIEGGHRLLDLVDAEDSAAIRADPKYRTTVVCGNVLIQVAGPGAQIVHYGGDSRAINWYRKGVLYFYNNTVVSRRTNTITLFRLQTNGESVDCRNNIFYWPGPGKLFAIIAPVGHALMENNWLKKGWIKCHEKLEGGTVTDKRNFAGTNPGFVNVAQDDFHLAPGSPAIKAAHPAPGAMPAALSGEYVPHQKSRKRASLADLGAFEFEPAR